jgi:hypothetical protein
MVRVAVCMRGVTGLALRLPDPWVVMVDWTGLRTATPWWNPWCAQATHVARRAVIPRFSSAQLFQVVADVPSYKEFVPWVVGSRIVRRESVRRKALCRRHDHAPGRTGSGSHPSPPPPLTEHAYARTFVKLVPQPVHCPLWSCCAGCVVHLIAHTTFG